MCISMSVGRNGANRWEDVRTVQVLLNLSMPTLVPPGPLAESGMIGSRTIAAIEAFQRGIVGLENPDGRVDPNGRTLRTLRERMPEGFSGGKLVGIMIHSTASNIAKYYGSLKQRMAANGINTPLRMAHFLAQIAHESAEFRYSEEIADGEAYEGRPDLGNTQPGDGKRFKGRGLIQLTGRFNYKRYGQARGKDYTTETGAVLLATDPETAVDVSCWFWSENGLNRLADQDDIKAVTKIINGGYNGLEERKAKLVRAKFFLVR